MRYLGVAPIQIHNGQDCFPGVTFVNDAYAKFSVNLNGPFKFNPKTLPNYRFDKTDRISKLPSEILFECINKASDSCFVALNLRMTNKALNEMAKDNRIWKHLFLAKFPWQNPDLKLRSWMKLYERRNAVLKENDSQNTLDAKFIGKLLIDSNMHNKTSSSASFNFINFIFRSENCEFEFECPITWPILTDGDEEPTERHCDKCNKTVYAGTYLKSSISYCLLFKLKKLLL